MTWTRIATAAILIPAVVALVLFTPTWAVAIATALITILALREYFSLGDAIGHRAYRLWTYFSSILLAASQTLIAARDNRISAAYVGARSSAPRLDSANYDLYLLQSPTTIFFIFFLGLTAISLWNRRPLVETLPAAGISSSALLLIAFPLSFAIRLHGIGELGPQFLLFALVLTWAADTVAYFVGRAFGKHLLAPKISPKKTWEGSIGGLLGSLLVAVGFHYWIHFDLGFLLTIAVIGNIAGQMGDLAESAWKRSAGVKDSGGLLPGHGGVLDRIDALILCIPVVWFYLVAHVALMHFRNSL